VTTVQEPTPDLLGLSGLEQLRTTLVGGGAPFGRLLGMEVEELEVGRAVFSLVPGERHYNPIGMVHGGIAATLLDSAMGCAVHSTLPPGVRFTTVDLHVQYTRAMTATTGRVVAIGETVHLGGRTATAQGRVIDQDGTLLAHGTTTCLIIR
jgi:uncharacterized protein (TIGR00369 family)